MIDQDGQHARWLQAIDLLGGVSAAGEAIGVSRKHMYRLIKREAELHEGFLRDTADALQRHARKCIELEKQITPAFSRNLVEGQARETGNRLRHRKD